MINVVTIHQTFPDILRSFGYSGIQFILVCRNIFFNLSCAFVFTSHEQVVCTTLSSLSKSTSFGLCCQFGIFVELMDKKVNVSTGL